MFLSERSRSDLYRGLCQVIDNEEAVGEMLSQFPARELDLPITRDHLRAEMALLDQKLTTQIWEVDRRLTGQVEGLRSDLSAELRRWFVATITVMVGLMGVMVTAVAWVTSQAT